MLDFAAELKVDSLLLSDLDVYESHETSYLNEIGKRAKELGIQLQAGTGSICGTSERFDKKHGSDIEHLKLCLRIAHDVGSNVARCYLGSWKDRKGKGLEPHMNRVVEVCKAVKSLAKELGVKIAIENHAGDMTGWQLKNLIERAGPDYVGATIDAGNAAFTFEDPIENLKILGPYVVSSGIRDTAVWKNGKNIQTWWKAMGEGNVDWLEYFKLWRKVCPNAPVQLETISQWGRTYPPKSDKEFWRDYQDIRDVDYEAYLKFVDGNSNPGLAAEDRHTKEFMKRDLEKSLKYCREVLGLGKN